MIIRAAVGFPSHSKRHPHRTPILVLTILSAFLASFSGMMIFAGHYTAADSAAFNILVWGTYIATLVSCFVPVRRVGSPAAEPLLTAQR